MIAEKIRPHNVLKDTAITRERSLVHLEWQNRAAKIPHKVYLPMHDSSASSANLPDSHAFIRLRLLWQSHCPWHLVIWRRLSEPPRWGLLHE